MKKFVEKDVAENPLYHDTWKLLKKYRDVVWSLEISVQHVRSKFEIEYGTSIEEFLDSIYLAGADLNGSDIEHHAKCIERSHKMLKLLDSAVELLRARHKNGEAYYWLLYYSFLSPQQLKNVEEIIENLRPHIRDISFRTYYRRRREAIDALSSVLWGYTSKDSLDSTHEEVFSIQRLYRYFAGRPLCCHPGCLLVCQPGSHRRFQAGRIPAQQHDQRLVGWRHTDRR